MGIPVKAYIDRRQTLGSVFLVANALIWYFTAANALQTVITSTSQATVLWSLHFGSLIFSFFVGTLLGNYLNRNKMFAVWTTLGVISPLLLFISSTSSFPVVAAIAVLFGISIGLGMPSSMAYFTQLTEARNRGHYGGLIMLLSGIGGVILGISSVGSVEMTAVILIIWRALGFTFLFMPEEKKEVVKLRNVSFVSVIREKGFVLYLLPWLMFSLVGYLTVPVQATILSEESIRYLVLAENVIGGAFALISGILIDIFGRKRIAIIGFVLVGIEFSILGLYPNRMESWIAYTVLDGIVWGTFFVLFIMSVWGDLSQKISAEKYYAIGIVPFFLSKYLSLVLAKDVAAAVAVNALFSFAAFFLFLAVLPLVYAPETLPEKLLKDRELKKYIEKAQKMVNKEEEKTNNNNERAAKQEIQQEKNTP